MTKVGEIERKTQNRVVTLFQKQLGYDYLGNWHDRENNSNIDEELLRRHIVKRKYSPALISKALYEINRVTGDQSKNLYDINKEVYSLLRYGVKVKEEAGETTQTVWLIDWSNPNNNQFAIAEKVTAMGEHTKRSDIVLSINGIAVGVLELKRSTVSVSEGIRQNLDNQNNIFIKQFSSFHFFWKNI